jgi:ADP-ribose pyrophosphatase YjhB (NUDIX family)
MDWLTWSRRIQAISQAGSAYSKNPFDLERYAELRSIAVEISALHLNKPPVEVAALITSDTGYPTPKIDVRAAVFDAQGDLLMVRERTDGNWSLPGGWADRGSTAGQMAERETLEETGYRVRATKLLAVWDRDRQGHPPAWFSCYKLFFRCELLGGAPTPNIEISEIGFFSKDKLPPLSLGRVTQAQVLRIFEHRDQPDLPTDFE